MRKPRWAYLLMLLVGAGLGVAIAGVPTRGQDPPLRVQTETSTTLLPTSTTAQPLPEAPPPTAPPSTVAPRTPTTRRR